MTTRPRSDFFAERIGEHWQVIPYQDESADPLSWKLVEVELLFPSLPEEESYHLVFQTDTQYPQGLYRVCPVEGQAQVIFFVPGMSSSHGGVVMNATFN